MNKISVYGSTGFIGGTFSNLFLDDVIRIPREQRKPYWVKKIKTYLRE